MALAIGDPAPLFDLPTDGGGATSLAALRGRTVVLFFFPKADTSGCTREAQAFSGLAPRFAAAGAVVIGVSADPVEAHDRFKSKHHLTVTLASDPRHEMIAAYGFWAQKSMYGRTYMGVERATVLIDKTGRIARIWPKVKIDGHAEAVLAAAEAL